MAAPDPLQIAADVRNACVRAALDGYERAQVAGLCQEGAWECAIDAIRMLDLRALLEAGPDPAENPRPHPGPASA